MCPHSPSGFYEVYCIVVTFDWWPRFGGHENDVSRAEGDVETHPGMRLM